MAESCQLRLAQYVASLKRHTTVDKISTAYKAFIFSNPGGRLADIIGNTVMGAGEIAKGVPATAADWALSKHTGIRTRMFHPTDVVRGTIQGGAEGLKDAARVIRTGVSTVDLNRAADQVYGEIQYKNPAMNAFVNGVFRMVQAMDRPFYWSAFNRSLRERARILGTNQGLKGRELSAFIEERLPLMSPEDVAFAAHDGLMATFQDQTAASRALSGLKQGIGGGLPGVSKTNPAGRLFAEFLLPVTKTPSNAAQRAAEYSGAGIMMGGLNVGRLFRMATNGDPSDVAKMQRYAVDQMGRGFAGAGALAAGAWLYQKGLITLGFPEDQKTRGNWEATGRQPNSVKIGDRWYSMERMAPWGPILIVGAYMQAAKDGTEGAESVTRGLSGMVAGIGNISADQPAFTGAEMVAGIKRNGAEGVADWAAQAAGSALVPSIVSRWANWVDPTIRERYLAEAGGQEIPEVLRGPAGNLTSRIPFASRSLPMRHDVLGEGVPRNESFLGNFVDPFNTRLSRASQDAVRKEMDRLGVGVTRLTYRRDSGETREQFYERREQYGIVVRGALAEVVASDEYQGLAEARREMARRGVLEGKDLQRMIEQDQREYLEGVVTQTRTLFTRLRKREGVFTGADGMPTEDERQMLIDRAAIAARGKAMSRTGEILSGQTPEEEQ